MSLPASAAPILLALDTATDRIHAALSLGDTVHTLDLPGGAQASSSLLPALNSLLSQAARTWADLDAIAFGQGPGAFTGLRTACSVTQGLALALNRPVIAIDTLMAVAECARLANPAAWSEGDVIWVLQDARMDELYAGAFRWDGTDWQVSHPAELWPLDEPARRWAPEGAAQAAAPRWAGNAARAYPDQLAWLKARELGVGPSADEGPAQPSGAALASLALRAWQRGETLDAALALPLYVRDKVAQTTAERQAAKVAKDAAPGGAASA
jgi:tRNA threonylcarbamoyladenosine biosynthesis protein TsaB